MFFNLYFLVISLSQLFPSLRVNYLITNIGPLSFVLLVTLSKEAYDDWKRYQRDCEANSQLYRRLLPGGACELVPSSDLRVGDLVVLGKDERVPADLILLRASDRSGSIFIRTDQLDGEIDWKLRVALPCCQRLREDAEVLAEGLSVYAEAPHQDIHSFCGTATLGGCTTEPLNVENTLWMNTVVASGQALGMVLYTGTDTRAVLNTSQARTKVGLTDQEINRLAKILCLVVVAMALTLVGLRGFHGYWHIHLIKFIVLFSTIIPISMRVNLDMAKTCYALEMMRDRDCPGVIIRTSTIPEELGRISYVLTDKTGTLTKNDMELKRLHVGTMCYGPESLEDLQHFIRQAARHDRPPSTIMTAVTTTAMTGTGRPGRRDAATRIYETVQALALCHMVTPGPLEANGERSYQASSPDEVAIVRWTERVGITLVQRDREQITLQTIGTESEGDVLVEFDILHCFPFTSETKRMGIVVRERQSGEILFVEKGADVVMSKIVQANDWLEEECDNMAREGLRTLVIGRRRLSPAELQAFEQAYAQARLSVTDRQAACRRVVDAMLEKDLELLGLTGVEDRLQEGVRRVLENLRMAGIRIWMLTGDKVETASNIALSTRLVERNQPLYTAQRLSQVEEGWRLIEHLRRNPHHALVLDGTSLQLLMEHMADEFMAVATELSAVVCCRCTPTQKADVARMIQAYTGTRVCCIGDGGNDVSMIQAADVGVGIVGKEGRQASLAADVSIEAFSHLLRLILWHGRNSYKRTAKIALFIIHRGFTIAIMQALFSAIFYFAPIALYQGLISVGYVTVYTMAPVFSLVLDRDVSQETVMLYPEVYKLLKGRLLSLKQFFKWIMISVYQGGVIMLLAVWLFENEFIHIVSITFTALILNELLMVALEIATWHWLMGVAEVGSFLIYVMSIRLLPAYFDAAFTTSLPFFWKVAVMTVISFLPLYLFKVIRFFLSPPSEVKLND